MNSDAKCLEVIIEQSDENESWMFVTAFIWFHSDRTQENQNDGTLIFSDLTFVVEHGDITQRFLEELP